MQKKRKSKALVLLSGGVDSSTLLFWAKQKYQCTALTFDYGQKHKREIQSAKRIAAAAHVPFIKIPVCLPRLKSGLTDPSIKIIKGRKDSREKNKKIPSTYVPGRNALFLSYAVSIAESEKIPVIFIGANAIDYSGYPDCRPDFIKAFQRMAQLGTKTGREGKAISVCAPLINKTKADIITLGLRLSVPYHLTWSCYRGGRKPCGTCDSCVIREKGFKEVQKSQLQITDFKFQIKRL